MVEPPAGIEPATPFLPSMRGVLDPSQDLMLRPGADATETDILGFTEPRLAAYKRPRQVCFLEDLPMTSTGTIVRRGLIKHWTPWCVSRLAWGARTGERCRDRPRCLSGPDLLEPMPPRRRRRSPRRTSRRSRSLDYLLAVVLVVGIGYLLLQRGVLPFPPEATRPFPEVDGGGDNSAAIGRLGGAVEYGHVDRATGQRSGVSATITPAMIAAAARGELGSAADPDIRPPGLDQLPARNRARAHLLGRQLGGTGDLPANLVALYQTRAAVKEAIAPSVGG